MISNGWLKRFMMMFEVAENVEKVLVNSIEK